MHCSHHRTDLTLTEPDQTPGVKAALGLPARGSQTSLEQAGFWRASTWTLGARRKE